MSKAKDKFIIIDGNALVHRSFHALPTSMQTKAGEVTNATYGFAAVLLKALKEFKPAYIVVTMDKKDPTFRHKEYADYKATRAKAPDELYAQFGRIREIITAFNIPLFEKSGFEADDLIGTIAKEVRSKKLEGRNNPVETVIVTGDLDTLQLVNDSTKIYTVSRGVNDSVLYDADAVARRFDGLLPSQIVDYKALRGDPSDNIPGVPGIGEKGAIELVKEFGRLEKLYQEVDTNSKKAQEKIKPRTLTLLAEHKKQAFLSQKLATIDCAVDIDFDLEKARTRNFDVNKVTALFTELEFKSLIARLQEVLGVLAPKNRTADDEQTKFSTVQAKFDYQLVDDEKKFKTFLARLKKQKIFAYDTETANFNALEAELLGISFSWQKGEAYYIEVKSKKLEVKSQGDLFSSKNESEKNSGLEVDYVIKNLKTIFADEKVKKICHNAKFDLHAIRAQGIVVQGLAFDTMLAAYLLDPGSRGFSLDACAVTYCGYTKISKDDLLGTGRNKINFAEVAPERLALYSCEDADFTWRLYEVLSKELKKEKLEKLFNEIEIPLISVLVDMESAGVQLDVRYLATLQRELAKKLETLTKKIHQHAGKAFNVNSTQQLQEVLFERLEIPTHLVSRTKTGYSTGADELAKLKGQHEIIDDIMAYRELSKLQNTYVTALPKLVSAADKRLHTSYNQTIAATGRLSSTDPNLQNIPVRTEEGRKIRKAFVAKRGCRLVSADYSQIELRLAAAMSGDKKMLAAFKKGEDIHAATAAEINGVALTAVTKEMRREAKAINFGILYGQGPFGLSQTADIPQWKAKEFIDKYFATYKDIRKWIDKNLAAAKKSGRVKTLFGRIRKMPEINSNSVQLRKAAERVAVNTPLQGTAADIIKIAMILVHEALKKKPVDAQLLLQVHDELVLEVKTSDVKKAAKLLKEHMEEVLKLAVPLRVDVAVGDNWEEMKELK